MKVKNNALWVASLTLTLVLFLFGCQQEEPDNPTPTNILSAPSPAPSEPPVNLIAPMNEIESDGASVVLEWNWTRELRRNERYDVRVWKEGEPELGITLTRQEWLNLANWLVYQSPGVYHWVVYVTQVENEEPIRLLTPRSEQRTFTVANVDDPAQSLNLPEGFQGTLRAATYNPTSLALGPDGTLFIATLTGDILTQNPDQIGTESTGLFASGFDSPTGLLFHEGVLYVSSVGRVTRLEDTDGDGSGDESIELFEAEVLPGRQYDAHSNNGLAIGPNGQLYIAVGGTSDHGPEQHPLGGTILRYDLAAGIYEVFARGFRNPYDLAFDADGNLFGGDNGPDAPDANLLEIPAEEINLIEEGGHYGYPDFFGNPPADSGTKAPLILVPASSVTTGLIIYDGDNFPAEYHGAIFITLWGSSVITHPTGHRVAVVQRSADGSYDQTSLADFARGVQRPIDVVQTEEGTIIFADFESGYIFEIEYVGTEN